MNGQHRYIQALIEQSNAGSERTELSGRSTASFGKHNHTVTSVDRLACVSEALPESAALRQRKNIEQCDHQEVLQLLPPTADRIPFSRRITHRIQQLTLHRHSEIAAETRRKCRLNKANIGLGDVV